jgi:hypothetical protein
VIYSHYVLLGNLLRIVVQNSLNRNRIWNLYYELAISSGWVLDLFFYVTQPLSKIAKKEAYELLAIEGKKGCSISFNAKRIFVGGFIITAVTSGKFSKEY